MNEQITANLLKYLLPFGILIVTILFAAIANRFFRRMIRRSAETMNSDPTNYQFLRHAVVAMIYVLGFSMTIYFIPDLRKLANSLLAGAGILAVAVGFASQHALSNIISGFFIVLFKPFRVNDRIKFRDLAGVIEDITLRHTVIKDFENRRVLVPNALISDEIIVNSDIQDEKICKWIDIGISYGSDINLARQIMREECLAHPLCIDGRTEEQIEKGIDVVVIRVVSLGDSAVVLRAYVWSANQTDSFQMGCDLYESIKKRFDRSGIEIPFPHRTVYMRSETENHVPQ